MELIGMGFIPSGPLVVFGGLLVVVVGLLLLWAKFYR